MKYVFVAISGGDDGGGCGGGGVKQKKCLVGGKPHYRVVFNHVT